MSEPASISSGIAARYAAAVFDLAKEEGALKALETDIDALDAALAASADLRSVIDSPILSRDDQAKAIAAVAAKMGLSATLANALSLMAANRRLFVLPHLIADIRERQPLETRHRVVRGDRSASNIVDQHAQRRLIHRRHRGRTFARTRHLHV